MYLQIKKIVLWPRRADLPPRVVSFNLGSVNVITGASKTGKSAIIPIIDYCLGAEKCSIPVKTIRDACGWFGIVLDTAHGELLLARREPGALKATGDMYVQQGVDLALPHSIVEHNANLESIKRTLDDMAGLTQLNFDPQGAGQGFKNRPSFRDMMAFVFQPQNIVANPNVLFYKADTTEHREKLRTIFPYVLGAVTPEALAIEHELRRLQVDLRRKERELATIQQLSQRWIGELQGKALRAYELGLITVPPSQHLAVHELIGLLRSAAAFEHEPKINPEALDTAAAESVALEKEEANTSKSLTRLKQRYADMTRFREASSEFHGSLAIRRDRLQVSEWVSGLLGEKHACPLCGTEESSTVINGVATLRIALQRIESQADKVAQMPVAFDREYQRVRTEIDLETERLNAVRVRRHALAATSEELRSKQYQASEAARFAGSLDEALNRYDQLGTDGELTSEVAELRERVESLESRLRKLNVRASTERAVQRFTTLAARVLPRLDSERPDDPVHLIIDDLTIRVSGRDRDDYLWEIGSGANWLSYHIASSVALHQLFESLPRSPVPSFAVYDQPSQVYFPKPLHDDNTEEQQSATIRDEDIVAVRHVFEVLAEYTRQNQGKWQAIVLDHAAGNVWGDIDGVSMVEEWRDGNKLVPPEWLA